MKIEYFFRFLEYQLKVLFFINNNYIGNIYANLNFNKHNLKNLK